MSRKNLNLSQPHPSAKLIASSSDIHEVFKFMHQSNMIKIKYYVRKDLVVYAAF